MSLCFLQFKFKLKKYTVTNEALEGEVIDVFLEPSINELDEVLISQYSLSGDISNDVENIPTYEDKLPLWNAKQLKQMRIARPDDAQSPVENLVLGDDNNQAKVTVNIWELVDLVSKAFKNKSRALDANRKVTDFYQEAFFIKELKIPETKYYNFLDFLDEETTIKSTLKTKDGLKILEFLLDQSTIFKQKYNIEE